MEIKKFEIFSDIEKIEDIEDFFLATSELHPNWKIKIIKSPSKYREGFGPRNVKSGLPDNDFIRKKGSHVIRFEISNKINEIQLLIEEVNKVTKRWNLKDRIHSVSTRGNKIIFSFEI